MIIYGTRQKKLKTYETNTDTCEACGHEGQLALGVVRYFHVFWIPLFLYKVITFYRCTHCQHTLEREGKYNAPNNLFSLKNTWPYYFGLFLVLGLVALGMIASLF